MSYNNSMSYSYRCPQLNWTIYICSVIPTLLLQCYPHIQSQNDISLAYSSSYLSIWTAKHLTKCFTLSYFRSLFNDHRRPLVHYVSQGYYVQLFQEFKELFRTSSDFYKDTKYFSIFLIFFYLFLKILNFVFWRTNQLLYFWIFIKIR